MSNNPTTTSRRMTWGEYEKAKAEGTYRSKFDKIKPPRPQPNPLTWAEYHKRKSDGTYKTDIFDRIANHQTGMEQEYNYEENTNGSKSSWFRWLMIFAGSH